MSDNKLGKLIRTLPETCPDCGKHKLQLRSIVVGNAQKGIELSKTVEMIQCPICYYETESTDKKRKEKVALRDSFTVVKEVKSDRYSKRGTASRSPRNDSVRNTGRNRR